MLFRSPEYDWDEADNLFLRYRYEFMPKGILTRFIVAINQLIADQNCVWKSGVILQKDGTRAEVIEYYEQKEIRLRINGRYQRDLMTEVILEFDRIHDSFNRLKCDKLIPCNCEECGGSQEPHFYKFEALRKYMAAGEDVKCDESFEMVNPRGLIDDVIAREHFSEEEKRKGGNVNIYGDVGKVITQNGENVVQETETGDNIIQKTESGNNVVEKKPQSAAPIKSAWANGSFYVFVFLVVIAGVGVLARTVPLLVLPIVLVAAILFVPLIGVLQLRQDDRLSEEFFVKLVGMVFKQLPLLGKLAKGIGKLFKGKQSDD